jgi:hypothetical protein
LRKEQIEHKKRLEEDIEREQQQRMARMKALNDIEQLAMKVKKHVAALIDADQKQRSTTQLEQLATWIVANSTSATEDDIKKQRKMLEELLLT